MKYALEKEFDYLITLDADFSHDPKHLPEMIEALKTNDFVTGSRYIEGGLSEYGPYRQTISRVANILARTMLNIHLKECTTAYRGFRRELLLKLNLDRIQSDGYSFMVEILFYITHMTSKMFEFPIHFEDRRAGQSKINKIEIFKSIMTLCRLFYLRVVSWALKAPL